MGVAKVLNHHKTLPKHLKLDRELAMAAILYDPQGVTMLPIELRRDKEFVLGLIRQVEAQYDSNLQDALRCPEDGWDHKGTDEGGGGFADALFSDEDICLAILGRHIDKETIDSRIDKKLLADRQFMLKAIGLNAAALLGVPIWLEDREMVLAAVDKYGGILYDLPAEYHNDREVVLRALQGGVGQRVALGAVEGPLREDMEIVRLAIANDGRALRYAPVACSDDEQLVLQAIARGCELDDAVVSQRLLDNREFVAAAVSHASNVRQGLLECLSPLLRDDAEIVSQVIDKDPWSIKYMSKRMQRDRGLIIRAMSKNGRAWQNIPEQYALDQDILLAAILSAGKPLNSLPKNFILDAKLVYAVIAAGASCKYDLLDSMDSSAWANKAFLQRLLDMGIDKDFLLARVPRSMIVDHDIQRSLMG